MYGEVPTYSRDSNGKYVATGKNIDVLNLKKTKIDDTRKRVAN